MDNDNVNDDDVFVIIMIDYIVCLGKIMASARNVVRWQRAEKIRRAVHLALTSGGRRRFASFFPDEAAMGFGGRCHRQHILARLAILLSRQKLNQDPRPHGIG